MKKLFSVITLIAMIFTMSSFACAENEQISVTIDGTPVEFDQVPVIIGGRTLVPMRAIFEKLGATVTWDDNTKTATGEKDGVIIKIQNQNNVMQIDSKSVTLDVPAQIINNRTLVPVRAISESFGYNVGWNGETRIVTISTEQIAAFNDETLKTVYNSTRLLGTKEYNPNDTFTYGELGNAAVGIVMNEKETSYFGLNTESKFNHTYARDFYYICNNVLGLEFMAEENIDKPATLADTAEVLSCAAAEHDPENKTITPEKLLMDKDGNKNATMKEFTEFIARIDDVAPLLVKIVISKDGKTKNIQTKINKNLSSYPNNASNFRVILSDISSSIYEKEIYNNSSSNVPDKCYDFVRDYRDIFIGILSPWVNKAAERGVEMEIEYYPSLCVDNKNGYTMRVICNIISTSDNAVTASDIFSNTPGSKTILKAGGKYMIDLCNNGVVLDVTMPWENVTMKKLSELK